MDGQHMATVMEPSFPLPPGSTVPKQTPDILGECLAHWAHLAGHLVLWIPGRWGDQDDGVRRTRSYGQSPPCGQ